MPSALQSQLASQLGGSHTHVLHKQPPSLIFGKKQAAQIDKDSLLSIARMGLLDLVNSETAFKEFESSLFSDKHRDINRTLMNKEENDHLDVIINRFLRLLSPYFLQSSSFKVLEWLIRQFKINELNMEDLIACALPYHETKQFVQVLQTMAISAEGSRWSFLKTVQKSQVPLDRATLVRRCHTDHSIMTFICNTVKSSKKAGIVHRSLYTFFACSVVQFVQSQPTLNQDYIVLLAPTLLSFVKVKDPQYGDLQAASQMILSQMATKAQFESELFTGILESVLKGLSIENMRSTLLCVVTLCQSQIETAIISSKMIARLSETVGVSNALMEIASAFETDKFMKPLLLSLARSYVAAMDTKRFTLFESLLLSGCIPENVSKALCKALIEDFKVKLDSEEAVKKIFMALHDAVPDVVDTCLTSYFTTLRDQADKGKTDPLYILTANLFKGTLSEPVIDSGTSLFLSLEHPSSRVRLVALKKLSQNLQDGEAADDLNVQDLVLNRIRDDDANVVQYALGMNNLDQLIEYDVLMKALDDLIWGSSGLHIRALAMSVLWKYYRPGHDQVDIQVRKTMIGFAFVFKDTVPVSVALHTALRRVDVSEFNFIKSIKMIEELEKDQDKKAYNLHVVAALSEYALQDNNIKLFLDGLESQKANIQAVSFLVLNKCIAHSSGTSQIKISSAALQIISGAYDSGKQITGSLILSKEGTPTDELWRNLSNVKDQIFRDSLAVLYASIFTLHNVIVSNMKSGITDTWFVDLDDRSKPSIQALAVSIFETIAKLGSQEFVKNLLLDFFKNQESSMSLQLCSNILMTHATTMEAKILGLKVIASFFKSALQSGPMDFQLLIPSLLIACDDSSKFVRIAGLECLRVLLDVYEKIDRNDLSGSVFKHDEFYGLSTRQIRCLKSFKIKTFIADLLSRREEITTEQGFLVKCLGQLLVPKSEVLVFLLTSVLALPLSNMQMRLLELLAIVDSPEKLKTIFPLLESSLKESADNFKSRNTAEALLRCYTPTTVASTFTAKSGRYSALFLRMLQCPKSGDEHQIWMASTVLNRLCKGIFESATIEQQTQMTVQLFHLMAKSPTELSQKSRKVLMEVTLSAQHILPILKEACERLNQSDDQPAKRSISERVSYSEDMHILTTVLEIMEVRSDIVNVEETVPELFNILKMSIGFASSGTLMPLEYAKQLIMSVLNSIFASLLKRNLAIEENVIDIDCLIQSIRVTDNAQTHNSAFLLLTSIAAIYPQLVLRSVMPIFTFMGANVMRQDDDFSFHILKKTVNVIVPALVSQKDQSDSGSVKNGKTHILEIKLILDIFLEALYHIPRHRRLSIYKTLVERLGVSGYLGRIVMMITIKSKGPQKTEKSILGDFEFAHQLLSEFETMDQLWALIQILKAVEAQLEEDNEQEHKISTWIRFVRQHLHGKHFVASVLSLSDDDRKEKETDLIETLLLIICKTEGDHLKHLFESLNLAMDLLSLPVFLSTISNLMHHQVVDVSMRAMLMLEEKIGALELNESISDELIKMVEPLESILQSSESGPEILEKKQVALSCLGELARLLSKDKPIPFTKLMPLIIGPKALTNDNMQLASSAMVTLAFICEGVGPRAIPYLPKFMPQILTILQNQIYPQMGEVEEIVCLTSFMVMRAIIDTIPQFISTYTSDMISLAISPYLFSLNDRKCAESATRVLDTLASKVAPRVLLPAVFARLTTAFESGRESLMTLFNLMGNILSNMTKTDLTDSMPSLTTFFLGAFDIRLQVSDKIMSAEDVVIAEGCIISSFLQLVLKLNESHFKPLFLKMVDWATLNVSFMALKDDQKIKRQLTLFRLMDQMFGRLKALAVPYHGYLLDATLSILEANEKGKDQIQLWKHTMSTLQKYFLYDSQVGLIDEKKFERIMVPLVDQLDNISFHEDDYLVNMAEYLIPTIGQFIILAKADGQRKALNRAVCMKSRSQEPRVRFIAIQIMREFYAKAGDEMLALFPETIPFIAELMEDDDEEVEEACQELCRVIQEYLGEPIQQYFSA